MDADVAADLRALAQRVRYNLPHRHNPEQFHIEKSEIERALRTIANRLDGTSERKAAKRAARAPVLTTEIIGGRRIAVQRTRKPFSIFVGGSA